MRALVVNKFRGDASLFDDGVRILRERTNLPVYVLPFVSDLGVPSEDGLAAENADSSLHGPRSQSSSIRTSATMMTSSRSPLPARGFATSGTLATSIAPI